MRRAIRVVAASAVAAVVAVLGFAGAAQAHVTVSGTATQGGYGRIAFRVPNESDTASTTKLEVQLPADQPVASVLTMPVPGWTAVLTTSKLDKPLTTDDGDQVTEAVTLITWTADSAATAIKPGQFLEFPVSLGPLPKAPSMTFKAVQTYSDGNVVSWIAPRQAGQPEPDNPAPVLTLTAAADSGDPGASAAPAAAASSGGSGGDTGALTVGIVGGLVGLAGLVVAVLALRRTRPAT
ncbi:MAG TPA: YcnI family protein [Rugosimonospora sp.]|nr:YcnI family protein [Rugosimonospora sp.]